MKIEIEESLKGILKIGFIVTDNLKIVDTPLELRKMIEELCIKVKDRYTSLPPSSIGGIRATRSLYKKIGIDPTKERPSSEALFKRALKDDFPFINSIVDTINFCSLNFLIPYGLYGAEKIKNKITIRKGEKGDFYETIGKGKINLEGKIAVFDEIGPFGNPTADSRRACVEKNTKKAITLIFLNYEEAYANSLTVLNFTESMISKFHPESKTEKMGIIE
ncbi:MAG: B3/B4 domain-containing protein [Candidatus Aminicenantia bacterium]